jgi:hypothetical protein
VLLSDGQVTWTGQRLGPSYFFISLVLGPLNSLAWYVPSFGWRIHGSVEDTKLSTNKQHSLSLRYTRGPGWRMHCGVEVTESSTNKQHHLSGGPLRLGGSCGSPRRRAVGLRWPLRRAVSCVRPCGTRAPALPLTNHAPWLHLSELCERVPFINKRTPRAPTKPNNAEAG